MTSTAPTQQRSKFFGGPINDLRVNSKIVPYLRLQRGSISAQGLNLSDQDYAALYRQDVGHEFSALKGWLPSACQRVLGIGSGMGGLELMIQRWYDWGRSGTETYLIDGNVYEGLFDEAEDHDHPFNSHTTCREFWRINGAPEPTCIEARDQHTTIEDAVFFDLVISTKAWCFHIEPERYLDLVMAHTHQKTMLIVDMREGRHEWAHQLERFWRPEILIASYAKYRRMVWRRR